jgi:hypothetical protein
MNFRREVLGLEELHFYDTYVPIIPDVNFTMDMMRLLRPASRRWSPWERNTATP